MNENESGAYFLADDDDSLLVHRVLRFESLADDFDTLARDLGL